MTPKQLEVFRAVFRHGTITHAASILLMTQPAVSKIILHTEDQIGFKLFRRVRGRLYPTLEAEILFKDAEQIHRHLAAIRSLTRELREGNAGLIRVGATTPPGFSILPRAVASFKNVFPGVRIITQTLPIAEMSECLIDGSIDLGLSLAPILLPGVETQSLGKTRIVCVLPRGHRLCERESLSATDLANTKLISYGQDTFQGRLLTAAFQAAEMEFIVDIEIGLSISAAPFVKANVGIALVDGLTPWRDIMGLVVRPFQPEISEDIWMITGGIKPLSSFAQQFISHLRKATLELSAEASRLDVYLRP